MKNVTNTKGQTARNRAAKRITETASRIGTQAESRVITAMKATGNAVCDEWKNATPKAKLAAGVSILVAALL